MSVKVIFHVFSSQIADLNIFPQIHTNKNIFWTKDVLWILDSEVILFFSLYGLKVHQITAVSVFIFQ